MPFTVCIGCPGPWVCWRRVWGGCWKRPTWNHCCWRITDPICLAYNFFCRALRAMALLSLRVARILVNTSRYILHAVNLILEVAKHAVRVSKHSLDIVIAILEAVKVAYQVGIKALSAIVRFGLGGIFDIREVAFDVGLSAAATGHFRVSVTLAIFNHFKKLSLNINLSNILPFIKSLGESILGGLTKYIF